MWIRVGIAQEKGMIGAMIHQLRQRLHQHQHPLQRGHRRQHQRPQGHRRQHQRPQGRQRQHQLLR